MEYNPVLTFAAGVDILLSEETDETPTGILPVSAASGKRLSPSKDASIFFTKKEAFPAMH